MNIAIIGTGTRGTQITQVMAVNGHMVAIYDADEQTRARALLKIQQDVDRGMSLGKLTTDTATRIKQSVVLVRALEQCAEADFILECIPEQLEQKKTLLEKLDRIAPRTAVIATTTTTFSVTLLASVAKRFPDRILGLHFFAPILTHKLVQVVAGDATSKDMLDRAEYLVRQLTNKESIQVKDSPGLLVDRLSSVYVGEALNVLGEGQVNAETIDKLMSSLGVGEAPFRWMDTQGIDKILETAQRLYTATFQDPRYRPHQLLRKLLDLNHLGRKTKQGFYKYDD